MLLKKTTLLILLLLPFITVDAVAWGVDGHRIVGVDALKWLDPVARKRIDEILGSADETTLEKACNWPDVVRKTPEWAWSSPLHYVNVPRHASAYDRQRDCPDGQCVTEGIIRYANELHRGQLSNNLQWQALAWLCHLVGDLHQPLHAGYADDRGANNVQIRFLGQDYNLHYFWDTALVRSRLTDSGDWNRPMDTQNWPPTPGQWHITDVAEWTTQSHELVAAYAYPAQPEIDDAFAVSSWLLIRKQWQFGAYRLATILNAVLGEGEPVLDRK